MGASFQRVEKGFSPRRTSFQNFIKVLKTKDFNGAGHPSWVSRAHPSLPLQRIYHFIDSLEGRADGRVLLLFSVKTALSSIFQHAKNLFGFPKRFLFEELCN